MSCTVVAKVVFACEARKLHSELDYLSEAVSALSLDLLRISHIANTWDASIGTASASVPKKKKGFNKNYEFYANNDRRRFWNLLSPSPPTH